VPRLLRHSRPPCELIFIDVGSLDGTADFLDGVAAAAPVRVEVVSSPAEQAFGAAVAEALARARGSFIAWVNNDVLVPRLWLAQLVGLATMKAEVGMAGPMANVAPPQQRVASVPYRLSVSGPTQERRAEAPDTEAVDRFAQDNWTANKGKWFEVTQLGGFCFLIKRELLAVAPLVEEKGEAGVFDAAGLSARVRAAGKRLAVCRDLFVHHFGSRLSAR
jgi:GT2 family glycosyltransferase